MFYLHQGITQNIQMIKKYNFSMNQKDIFKNIKNQKHTKIKPMKLNMKRKIIQES